MTSGAAPIVVARDLTRAFRDLLAVDGLGFEIVPGEIFGIVGPDGSGKTTLLQMLAAILDPTGGACEVLGFDTVRQADQVTARIGYMSQGFTLYERLTVDENLAFAAAVRSVERAVLRERQARLLGMAGLEPFTARRAGRLSGGMRKKLALCTSLIHEPRVLLLDEPSLGVDPLSRRELWVLLESYREQGAAIVLATSYMDEAERCDRVLFLHQGRALALGPPGELKAQVVGHVFEVETTQAAALEDQLAADAAVRTFARLPGRIRLQFEREMTEAAVTRREGLRDARPVPPRLEDLFAAVAPVGTTAEVAATPSRERAPGQEGSGIVTVHARNVTCRFGDFVAVDDVSLQLHAGEVFGFLGPNGAGKTTLIRMLCGLQPFQSGEAHVAGLNVRRQDRQLRSRIGYMSQRFSLYPDLTVTENLEFFAGVYGLRTQARAAALAWAFETASLYGLGKRKVSEVSGAVRQRLALAASVLHHPQVLFLDEPTSGVDPLSRHRFWRLVHALAEEGVTAFVTTHYMEEAAYCHRLGLMLQGRLIALGSMSELQARGRLPEASTVEDLFLHYIERAREAA